MRIVKTPDWAKEFVRYGFDGLGRDHPGRPRHVYVIWHGEFEIVYVGCTVNPARRTSALKQCDWWDGDMSMQIVATFARDPQAAFAYERHLIHTLEPANNITGNPKALAS